MRIKSRNFFPNSSLSKKGKFWKDSPRDQCLTITPHHVRMFLKFRKTTKATIVYLFCLIIPQNFKKILRELIIRLRVYNFGPI